MKRNVNGPVFGRSAYNRTVPVSTQLGAPLLIISATDSDQVTAYIAVYVIGGQLNLSGVSFCNVIRLLDWKDGIEPNSMGSHLIDIYFGAEFLDMCDVSICLYRLKRRTCFKKSDPE